MKKTFGFLAVCATLAMLSLPVFANTTYSVANETLQDPCNTEGKIALYGEFYKELTKDQAKAYEAAKKYVACPAETGEQTQEVKDAEAARITYLKKFINKYEMARRKDQLTNLINKKDYPAAFELAKQVFVDDPNYLKGYMLLALNGAISDNPALAGDTITYAQKALSMIESGTTPTEWAPFDNKDDALAKLNYAIGMLSTASNPDKALTHLIKAVGYNSKVKTTPLTYAYLADAYERVYAKQNADYEAKYKDAAGAFKDETPESKLALENINQTIDRVNDAYARAVALAGTDPVKDPWLKRLTELYVYKNKSPAGLNEMIAGILSKPLPPVPTPITTLPTPAATPVSNSATGTAAPGTNSTAPAGTQPANSTQPKPSASPVKPPTTSTTTRANTPTKPKTRRAHAPRH